MARYTYNASLVTQTLDKLYSACDSLDSTNVDIKKGIDMIFEQLMQLSLTIYTPSLFIHESRMDKYTELFGDYNSLTQAGREQGIRRLTAINLMKRMESSVYSFNLTLMRIKDLIENTIDKIENFDKTTLDTIEEYDKHSSVKLDLTEVSESEFDSDDQSEDLFTFGKKVKIDLADMDYVSWSKTLKKDFEILELLTLMVGDITPEYDCKLQELFEVIKDKIENPINDMQTVSILKNLATSKSGELGGVLQYIYQ